MKPILVLALIFVGVYAKCVCPHACEDGYTGTYDACMCFCERHISAVGGPPATCGFFPSGEFSTGGCGLCSGTGADDPDGKDVYTKIAVSEPRDEPNDDPLFPVDFCYCYNGDCSMYFHGEQACQRWCDNLASEFIGGKTTMNWFPSGDMSTGGCNCCGKKDPCLVHH